MVSQFSPQWAVSVFITLHTGKNRSLLPDILNWDSPLRACFAEHRKPFGREIYIAPPDQHLIIGQTAMSLSAGPKENHCRPAIDPMFRSAAHNHGPNVTGILLTGYLFDGMNGLYEVHRQGGMTIVQDPTDAEVPDMHWLVCDPITSCRLRRSLRQSTNNLSGNRGVWNRGVDHERRICPQQTVAFDVPGMRRGVG